VPGAVGFKGIESVAKRVHETARQREREKLSIILPDPAFPRRSSSTTKDSFNEVLSELGFLKVAAEEDSGGLSAEGWDAADTPPMIRTFLQC
jgi:hypothetical protein